MTTESTPVEVTFRNMDPNDRVKDYIDDQLGEAIRSIPNLRWASVEVSFEDAKAAEQRYVVQITLLPTGPSFEQKIADRIPCQPTTEPTIYWNDEFGIGRVMSTSIIDSKSRHTRIRWKWKRRWQL